jgi:hypothetical protein
MALGLGIAPRLVGSRVAASSASRFARVFSPCRQRQRQTPLWETARRNRLLLRRPALRDEGAVWQLTAIDVASSFAWAEEAAGWRLERLLSDGESQVASGCLFCDRVGGCG